MTSSVADREAGAFERAQDDLRRVLGGWPAMNILIVGDRAFFLAPSHVDLTRLRNVSGLVCRLTGEPLDEVCLGMVLRHAATNPHKRAALATEMAQEAAQVAMDDLDYRIDVHIV